MTIGSSNASLMTSVSTDAMKKSTSSTEAIMGQILQSLPSSNMQTSNPQATSSQAQSAQNSQHILNLYA